MKMSKNREMTVRNLKAIEEEQLRRNGANRAEIFFCKGSYDNMCIHVSQQKKKYKKI